MDDLNPVTAVILAGGKSSRMGRDKLMLTLGGETLLQRAVRRFGTAFERVLISVADLQKYPEFADICVADIHPGLGPVSGLHAALLKCGGGVFLAAADMPYACPDAAREMVRLADGYDACVIRHQDGRLEPLFAYYGAAALSECVRVISEQRYNIARIFDGVSTRYVSPDELGAVWSDRLLLNVNEPAEFEKIQKLGPHA